MPARRRIAASLVVLSLLAFASTARSAPGSMFDDQLVVESYAGDRPAVAERILVPLRAELQARGFVAEPTILTMRLDEVVRPGLVGESLSASDLSKMFENGIRAWNSGDVEGALAKLEAATSTALRNPSLLSRVGRLRDQLFQGFVLLSVAQRRSDLGPASEVTMGELIRTFPTRPILQDEAGPEAYDLYRFVLSDLARSGRGSLSIRVSDPSSVVFINEVLRQSASGSVELDGLVPGTYRVLVRSLDVSERVRVYNVPVYADQRTALDIAWDLDSVLVIDNWFGFRFATTAEQANEAAVARKLGIAAKTFSVITISLTRNRTLYRLTAKRYATRAAELRAVCQLDLAGPDRRALATLADCIAGTNNRAAVTPLPPQLKIERSKFFGAFRVEPLAPTALEIRREAPTPLPSLQPRSHVAKWLWGAGGLIAIAAGGTLLYLHGSTPCDGPSSDCKDTYDTRTAGFLLLGTGGAALGVSTYIFVTETESVPPRIGTDRSLQNAWIAGIWQRW